jgi:hypothetical protein
LAVLVEQAQSVEVVVEDIVVVAVDTQQYQPLLTAAEQADRGWLLMPLLLLRIQAHSTEVAHLAD